MAAGVSERAAAAGRPPWMVGAPRWGRDRVCAHLWFLQPPLPPLPSVFILLHMILVIHSTSID